MAPTPGNVALLEKLNEGNGRLVWRKSRLWIRCCAAQATLRLLLLLWPFLTASGLPEPVHTLRGNSGLSRMPLQSKRTALLIYRLIQ